MNSEAVTQEFKVERVCVGCGHSGLINAEGVCRKVLGLTNDGYAWYCNCKCTFPAEPPHNPTAVRLANALTGETVSPAPLSVEQALVELREMFPGESFIYVRWEVRHSRTAGREVITGEPAPYIETVHGAKIQIGGTSFVGATLAECMQQVRQWKEKQ